MFSLRREHGGGDQGVRGGCSDETEKDHPGTLMPSNGDYRVPILQALVLSRYD
jgi:hypothetical protein